MAGLGMNLGAGLSQGYSQSANSGGSVNNSVNNSYSYNNSWNNAFNDSSAMSWSGTDAATARAWSAYMADQAWARDMDAFEQQMWFNRTEAEKQRQWQADMANSIYTRSVKNMKEAGINPILAYSMGLSGAGVGSGATASLGGSPQAPLAQNFMDSWSGSNSWSHGETHGGSFGEGFGEGSSSGSSWNSGWSNSEEGIVTALQNLGDMADTALAGINAGNTLDYLNNIAGGNPVTKWGESVGQKIRDSVAGGVQAIGNAISDKINDLKNSNKSGYSGGGGGHGFNKKMKSF